VKGSRALLALSVTVTEIVLAGCSRHPAGIEALASALGPVRTIEPRLAGSFGFSPCQPEPGPQPVVRRVRCASPAMLGAPARRELAVAAQQIRRQAARRPSAATLHAEGLLDLLLSRDGRDVERSVRLLERARTAAPTDAQIVSDLAAGYLVRAAARNDALDLALALDAAEHAVGAAPALPAAQFNRALALEQLALVSEARAAWTAYLALDDPASPWAAEARRHRAAGPDAAVGEGEPRQALVAAAERNDRRSLAALVAAHPQVARELVEHQLLGEWAAAYQGNDRSLAASRLSIARAVAAALAAAYGEHLALDSVELVESATASSPWLDRERRGTLVRGHRAFSAGHGLYLGRQVGRARVELQTAVHELRRAGSPMAAEAAFFLACCEFLEGRYLTVLADLAKLDAEPATRRYPALQANIARMEALSRTAVGRPIQAIPAYAAAIALFEQIGERENAAWAHALLGESLARLGRRRLAWEHCVRALRVAAGSADRRTRFLAYTVAADRAMENGQPEVAIRFRDEVLRNASPGDSMLLADAWLWHGLAEDRLGRRDRAWKDLEQARAAIERHEDAAQRQGKLSDLALVEGMILAAEQPRRAVERLTAALRAFEENQQDVLFSLTAHRLRAQAYRRLGDGRRAEADLEAAIAAYGRLAEGIEEPEVRQAFREESAQAFDDMIALEVDLGKPERAFDFADRERSRAAPARQDGASVGHARRAGSQEGGGAAYSCESAVRSQIPEDTALVQFAWLADRRLIWVVRRGRHELLAWPGKGHGLDEPIEGLRSARTLDEWRAPASELFDQLVRPWLDKAAGVRKLVIVPDKHTEDVPFAALSDRRNGRMLLEGYTVAVFPSAELFLGSLRRPGTMPERGGGRILVVGNPDFTHDAFPDLAPLAGAEAEARAVASLYRDRVLLLGKQATRQRFLTEAARSRRIELAGHYVVNQQNPLRSMLLLAPSAGDPGILYASEIYSLPLENVDLVALSACATGSPTGSTGEGAASLAQAFLAAGAHAVLASLWQVGDDEAARLSVDFHRALLAGGDPVQALRQAQLLALHGGAGTGRSPADWGAFEIIGASAPQP